MNITTAVERITPAVAQAMLAGNEDNRAVRPSIVEQYAGDMATGKWMMTGQPIILSLDGKLNDGQHRLHAIIKSGAAVDMLVTRGVERDTRAAIDTGKARCAGDILQMFHIENGNAVAALAARLIAWEKSAGRRIGRVSDISKTEIVARSRADGRARWATKESRKFDTVMVPGHIAFALYVIPDGVKRDLFFERVLDGVGLEADSPALALRNWTLRNGRKVPYHHGIEAILRAWCAYRDARPLVQIKLLGEFPKP